MLFWWVHFVYSMISFRWRYFLISRTFSPFYSSTLAQCYRCKLYIIIYYWIFHHYTTLVLLLLTVIIIIIEIMKFQIKKDLIQYFIITNLTTSPRTLLKSCCNYFLFEYVLTIRPYLITKLKTYHESSALIKSESVYLYRSLCSSPYLTFSLLPVKFWFILNILECLSPPRHKRIYRM